MKMTDLQAVELTKGKHYHAWALMPMLSTIYTGRRMTSLVYVAAQYPHADRSTARRHAREMATDEYGPSGFMALLCGGGQACPFLFDPWDQTSAEEDRAARYGTETVMETQAREAREAKALAQAHQEIAEAGTAFINSGVKAMLTPWHDAKGGENDNSS